MYKTGSDLWKRWFARERLRGSASWEACDWKLILGIDAVLADSAKGLSAFPEVPEQRLFSNCQSNDVCLPEVHERSLCCMIYHETSAVIRQANAAKANAFFKDFIL